MSEELQKVKAHNEKNFSLLLPEEKFKEKINVMVENNVSYHDLENLLKRGCSKELAIEILV